MSDQVNQYGGKTPGLTMGVGLDEAQLAAIAAELDEVPLGIEVR